MILQAIALIITLPGHPSDKTARVEKIWTVYKQMIPIKQNYKC